MIKCINTHTRVEKGFCANKDAFAVVFFSVRLQDEFVLSMLARTPKACSGGVEDAAKQARRPNRPQSKARM